MRRIVRTAIALMIATYGLAAASDAGAVTVYDDEEATVDLLSWFAGGYLFEKAPDEHAEEEYDPYLAMARLGATARYEGIGSLHLELGAASGTTVLLDAVGTVQPWEVFALRAGRFKTPTSAEFLEHRSEIPFVHRAPLVDLTHRRKVGVEALVSPHLGPVHTRVQVGLFHLPTDFALPHGGTLFSARVLAEVAHGVEVHVAYADRVDGELADDAPHDDPSVVDGKLDVALVAHTETLRLHAEGLVALDTPGDETPYGLTFYAGLKLGEGPLVWEPIVGYDLLRIHGETEHCITAGLNLFRLGERAMARIDYALEIVEEEVGHIAAVELQIGL
ncbi:MAG: porin [Myxococcota bacterium]